VLVILFDNPSDLDVTHQEGHCMKSGPLSRLYSMA